MKPAIRHGSLFRPQPPMPEARRLHIFGKIVPMDVQDLYADVRQTNEPGKTPKSLLILCLAIALWLLAALFVAGAISLMVSL